MVIPLLFRLMFMGTLICVFVDRIFIVLFMVIR